MGYHKLYPNAWLEHFFVWLRCGWQSSDQYFFSEDFRDNVSEAPQTPPFSLSIWKCVFYTLLAPPITLENKIVHMIFNIGKIEVWKTFLCFVPIPPAVPIHPDLRY